MDNVFYINAASSDQTNQLPEIIDVAALEAEYETLTRHDNETNAAHPLKISDIVDVADIPGIFACSQTENARFEFIQKLTDLRTCDPSIMAFKARVLMAEYGNDRDNLDYNIDTLTESHPDQRDVPASLALSVVRDLLDQMGEVPPLTARG